MPFSVSERVQSVNPGDLGVTVVHWDGDRRDDDGLSELMEVH